MKLLNITDATASYPRYASTLFTRAPGLDELSYASQADAIETDHFVWGMPYHRSMAAFGYDVLNVDRGIHSLQRAWAQERGLDPRRMTGDDVVIAQARAFRPDVVLYDCAHPKLLRRLLDSVPTIRLVLGWAGSALTAGRAWDMIDIMMTCAPESIPRLTAMGLVARHVNHAFDPNIDVVATPDNPTTAISFVGSIVRRSEFHMTRERLLLRLCESVPVTIYSPNATPGHIDYAKAFASGLASASLTSLRRFGLLRHLQGSNHIRRAERIASPMRRPVHPLLAGRMRPGVYGLDYFAVLRQSAISFNIHADTSPTHASNIRLYEATGMGSCLLTDWKANIADLYIPDVEVVVYRSGDEAVEKAQWLLDHPSERRAIAEAGRRKTLSSHTFAQRAQQIDDIIRHSIR